MLINDNYGTPSSMFNVLKDHGTSYGQYNQWISLLLFTRQRENPVMRKYRSENMDDSARPVEHTFRTFVRVIVLFFIFQLHRTTVSRVDNMKCIVHKE